MCETCWNAEQGLCLKCAPNVAVEIEAARVQGQVYGATEKAVNEGIQRGKKMDVKTEHQLVCPKCRTPTGGAKFCPNCGTKLAVSPKCPSCGAAAAEKDKFCPECGAKMA